MAVTRMKLFLLRCSLLMTAMMVSIGASMRAFANTQQIQPISVQKKLAALEDSSGGRIGVSAINTANNMRLKYRANEHFPMGCTSKVMGVSAILKKSMVDKFFLQQKITYAKKDLTNWAPITEKHLADGMTI